MTPPLAARGSRIRIALIDDHTIVREGLKHLLETEPDLEVVAEGTDGADALRVVRETHPDVLLLDEPTASLDPASALEIEALVSAWFDDGHDERASIWVSHDPAQAKRVGDRQFVMTAGTLS